MNKKFLIISLLFLNIFNYLDLVLTLIGINNYGLVIEGNPIIIKIIENLGFISMIIIKIVGMFIISLLAYRTNIKINNKYYTNFFCLVLWILIFIFLNIIIEWSVFLF